MNNKTMVGLLSILITENCNLKCKHCFRGENINVDITDETIENTFSKIDEIGLLIITGGEPLYSTKTILKIKKIIDTIKQNNVIVHQIQVITNGTKYNEQIEQTLYELYDLAINKKKSGIYISKDKYHKEELERLGLCEVVNDNANNFISLANKIGIHFGYHIPEYIVDYGRAKNLPEAKKVTMFYWGMVTSNLNKMQNCVRELHITPDGSVMPHGQMPYDFLEQYTIFNINEQNDILTPLSKYVDDALEHLDYVEQFISLSKILNRNDLRCLFN